MKHTHTHTYRTKLQHHVLLAAINNHLSKECTFILTTVAPELMEYPKNQLTIEGSNMTFSCIAGGVPSPRISWTINGTAINVTANPRINLTADGQQLIVTNVNRTDSGEYRCVASDKVGNVTSMAAKLTVQCKDTKKWSIYLIKRNTFKTELPMKTITP